MVMETLAIALGHSIRKERRKHGLSQDVLALTSNLDRSYVGRIERGEVSITVEKLYRIAKVLGCDPADLLPPLSEV